MNIIKAVKEFWVSMLYMIILSTLLWIFFYLVSEGKMLTSIENIIMFSFLNLIFTLMLGSVILSFDSDTHFSVKTTNFIKKYI